MIKVALVLLGLIVIAILICAFFLFALWRAVLGKSSVDINLNTSINLQTKKLDILNKNFTSYSGVQENLISEIQEASRLIKKSIDPKVK